MLDKEKIRFINENHPKMTIGKMAAELNESYHVINWYVKKNKLPVLEAISYLTPEQANIIRQNEGKKIHAMCLAIWGEKYSKPEFDKVQRFCKKHNVHYERERCQYVTSKSKNIYASKVIEEQPKQSFVRPPAVYSNPNYQTMYL